MFICVCNAITEKEIIESITKGNDSLEKLKQALNIATSCGCCEKWITDYINNIQQKIYLFSNE